MKNIEKQINADDSPADNICIRPEVCLIFHDAFSFGSKHSRSWKVEAVATLGPSQAQSILLVAFLLEPSWYDEGNRSMLKLRRGPSGPRFLPGKALSSKRSTPNLIAAAGARSNWPQALHLWKSFSGPTDAAAAAADATADATMKALGRGLQWERAAAFLGKQLMSPTGHEMALRTVASATAWRHCLAILGTMQLRRVDMTATSLIATMVSCGRRFMWQTALHLLTDQPSLSRSETSDCAMAVLTALQVAHQWEQAVALYSLFTKSPPYLPKESHLAVVEACKRSHAWQMAINLLQTATADEFDNTCHAAMRACAISSEWQAALSLLSHTKPQSVSTALSALAKAMQWQRAIQLFNDTQTLWLQNSAVTTEGDSLQSLQTIADRSLLRALGAGHLWRNALLHLRQDAWSYSAGIWACQAAGQQHAANELLSQHLSHLKSRRSKRKELQLLEHLSQFDDLDIPQILRKIEGFANANRWLKVAGGDKGRILETVIKPGDRVLEIGTYVGFTALRLAQHGCHVVTIEADPGNAAVAQQILEMAKGRNKATAARVKILVGRATDWLSSGLLDSVDVLLLDHRGTIYHEDPWHFRMTTMTCLREVKKST